MDRSDVLQMLLHSPFASASQVAEKQRKQVSGRLSHPLRQSVRIARERAADRRKAVRDRAFSRKTGTGETVGAVANPADSSASCASLRRRRLSRQDRRRRS